MVLVLVIVCGAARPKRGEEESVRVLCVDGMVGVKDRTAERNVRRRTFRSEVIMFEI